MNKKPVSKQSFDLHRTLPNKKLKDATSNSTKKKLESVAEVTITEKRHGFSWKRGIASIFLLFLVFILVIGAWDAVQLSKASKKMFGSGNLLSLLGGDLASADGRTNILLVGYSADDPGHNGANLTDSIMLISLDSNKKTGYILSIPRDLWVMVPGYGYAKINEAYQIGEREGFSKEGYAPGGMGQLESIVSQKLNVAINYYALINYSAFRETVDAVGGITLNIQSSDPRGLYDPSLDYTSLTCCALADYPNGQVKLNGKQALNLARARGDAYGSYGFAQSDFDRTNHQRQMLQALKNQAVSWSVILNPLKAGHLFDGMANNVTTDLDTGNVLPLFSTVNNIKDLKSVGLRDLNGKNYLGSYGGALIPLSGINDYSEIQAALENLNQ